MSKSLNKIENQSEVVAVDVWEQTELRTSCQFQHNVYFIVSLFPEWFTIGDGVNDRMHMFIVPENLFSFPRKSIDN